MTNPLRRLSVRRVAAAAAVALAAVGGGFLWSSGHAASGGDPRGTWALHFEAAVGPTTETVVGMFTVNGDGTCKMLQRTDVGGLGPSDKSSSTCTWGPIPNYPGIGWITAVLPGNELAQWEFVVGEGGKRMFLMLTGPQGYPSTGEATKL